VLKSNIKNSFDFQQKKFGGVLMKIQNPVYGDSRVCFFKKNLDPIAGEHEMKADPLPMRFCRKKRKPGGGFKFR